MSYLNELRFDLTHDQLRNLSDEIMKRTKEVLDQVSAIEPSQRTFDNTVRAITDNEGWSDTQSTNCTFLQHVSTDKETRNLCSELEKKLSAFFIDCSMREDIYQAVLEYKKKEEKLDEIDQRVLDRLIRDFERNGLALPQEKREKLKELKKKISEKCIEFSKNLGEESTKLFFTQEELEGLPESFFSGLSKNDEGKYIVTLKYPDLFPVMKYAKRDETRHTMDRMNSMKCQENVALLEDVICMRHECALLLGFNHHADYILQIRMAKNQANVAKFLNDLNQRVQPLAENDLKALLLLKEQEKQRLGLTFDGKLHSWDFHYYNRIRLETEYQVDEDAVKDYFPLETVTNGMLQVYQLILDLKFEKVEKPYTWHEDVQMYAVYDAPTKEFLGHFYLDIFPRDGKYGHAAAFGLQPGYLKKDGTRQKVAAAMVANFTKPTADKPSLLKFDEVETYFHEFGHIMHNLCTTVRYSKFHGTRVERDFVEAPSQMLENWCYEKTVLEKLSGHYKDTTIKLPDSMLAKLSASRNATIGLLTKRQLFFGIFDTSIHTNPNHETRQLWTKLRKEISLIEHPLDYGNPVGSFGHLASGYDAQYYGYLYSEVFSADMYSIFLADPEGALSKVQGTRYRDIILAHGGSRDSMNSLVEFLGREPSTDAFLKQKGLN